MPDDASQSQLQPAWPRLAFQQFPWVSRLNPDHLTRSQRQLIRKPYLAAVVPAIAELTPAISVELASEVDEATVLLTRFDAEVGPSGLPFAPILLRSESASSSEIEHLTSGARAIGEAELGERDTGNAALIVRNVRAMEAALALANRIDAAGLITMQSALLASTAPELTGDWRREQVWVGGSSMSPHNADFVPPHHDLVAPAIDDLVAFIKRPDIPTLIHVAIAHAQFETIHPFPDGNGRTGRALVQAMLRNREVTTNVTVPVSAGLLHDVDDYYSALDSFRAGSIEPIVSVFTRAAGYAVLNGRELVSDITDIRNDWVERISDLRSDAAARRVAALAIDHPVLNQELVVRELGISSTSAFRALDSLVQRNVLRQANSQRRNRVWLADPVLAALDDFAARAGRRRSASSN